MGRRGTVNAGERVGGVRVYLSVLGKTVLDFTTDPPPPKPEPHKPGATSDHSFGFAPRSKWGHYPTGEREMT